MTSSDRCWQLDQFGLSNMSGCWRIDRGLTLKLKDLRSFPHRILRPVCSGSHAEQNETRIDRKCSAEVNLPVVKAVSTSKQRPLGGVSGKCRAVYHRHRLVSVVCEGGDRWASRSSSQSSQVDSGKRFQQSIDRRCHREGDRREAADRSVVNLVCENLWE